MLNSLLLPKKTVLMYMDESPQLLLPVSVNYRRHHTTDWLNVLNIIYNNFQGTEKKKQKESKKQTCVFWWCFSNLQTLFKPLQNVSNTKPY